VVDVLFDFLLVVQLQTKSVAIYARALTMTLHLGFKFHYECSKSEVDVNMTRHFFNMGSKANIVVGVDCQYFFKS
jgi:hypothetical protein